MRIDELTVGPVQTRCYVLGKEDGQECIVIDPGDEAERIRKAAGDRKIAAILLTHGHFDHIGAVRELYTHEQHNAECRMQNAELKDKSPRIFIHEQDAPMLGDPALNASMGLMGRQITAPEATDLVREGDELEIAGLKIKVQHEDMGMARTLEATWRGIWVYRAPNPAFLSIARECFRQSLWHSSERGTIETPGGAGRFMCGL